MSKRVRKYNYRPYLSGNIFSFGGGFKEGLGGTDSTSLGRSLGQNIGGVASVTGGLASAAIGGKYSSKVGSIFNETGKLASTIPGPWGAGLSFGLQTLGGLYNRLGGVHVNQEALNEANAGTDYYNNFKSVASNFDQVKGPAAMKNVGKVYSGGLLVDVSDKNQALIDKRIAARDYALAGVDTNIRNLAKDQTDNALAVSAAFGGPLSLGLYPVGGAIDYEIAQRRLNQKDLELQKAQGGPLHTHGDDWTNGVIVINNGGSHESNPLEGVPMGVAPDGEPNLVEEGEVIYNDYVFSNRIKVPDAVRQKYKLRGPKDMTFADAAKTAQKESEERPNDPISKRGLEDIMNKLMMEQEYIRQKKQSKGGRRFDDGGPFDQWWNTYVTNSKSFGVDPADIDYGRLYKSITGLEGPTKSNEVQSNLRNYYDMHPEVFGPYDWKNYTSSGATGAPTGGIGANNLLPEVKVEAPSLDISPVEGLSYTQVPEPQVAAPVPPSNIFAPTIPFEQQTKFKPSAISNLRFLPAVGSTVAAFSDLMGWTNQSDYSNADLPLKAADSIKEVSASPIGDYLRLDPFDKLYYANQLGAQASANRRGILNTSGGNRGTAMAGLLAADAAAQDALSKLDRQGAEFEAARAEKEFGANRGTNIANVENALKAASVNADIGKTRTSAAAHTAAMRDAIDARMSAAQTATRNAALDNWGEIGRESYIMDMIKNNPALYYNWLGIYKGALGKKNGGYLTIKKRRK